MRGALFCEELFGPSYVRNIFCKASSVFYSADECKNNHQLYQCMGQQFVPFFLHTVVFGVLCIWHIQLQQFILATICPTLVEGTELGHGARK